MGFCNKKCCTICGIISFAVLIVFSGCIYLIAAPIINEGLEDEFVVDSEDHESFSYWACKYSLFNEGVCAEPHDSVGFNEAYYVFNLTNMEDVLNGALPIFEEFGPYFYEVDIVKYDIVFLDDGMNVEYGVANTYYFNPEMSCEGCLPTDQYIAINAGYLGAVDTAGGETTLVLGMGGPAIGKMIQDINSTYIQSLVDADGLQYWIDICKTFDESCETQTDLALLQWGYYETRGRQLGLNNVGVNTWDPVEFPWVAEYSAINYEDPLDYSFSLDTSRKLLYGEKGIVAGPLFLLELLGAALSNQTELEEYWGLTFLQATNFGLYITTMAQTYSIALFEECTILEQGGGLFSKRSVHQWVFDFADPLLVYMQPRDPQTSVRYNDTSIDDARSYKPGKMAIKTGKNDFRNVANVTMWNGTTTIDFWAEPVTIWGNNQDGQFFPHYLDGKGKLPSTLEDFDIFSPDHGRTIFLTYINETLKTSTGIEVYRYVLRNETYDPDPVYFQSLTGFINASFHMNPPFRKRIEFGAYVPLFLSQPRFWAIDTPLARRSTIINAEPNLLDCATIVDIEPVSGNALGAYKRLQVNFYYDAPNNRTYGRFHENMVLGVMYPTVYISQEIFVTPELEDKWNSELGIYLDALKIIFIAGLTIGSVGLVLCIVYLVILSKPREGYEAIN